LQQNEYISSHTALSGKIKPINGTLIMKKASSKKHTPTKDPKKESVYKSLVGLLEENGYQVRREKLKRGLGWKVYSGACRAVTIRIIFVDQRLGQDEQINFLQERIQVLGLERVAPVV
jgi:hypothetical protein